LPTERIPFFHLANVLILFPEHFRPSFSIISQPPRSFDSSQDEGRVNTEDCEVDVEVEDEAVDDVGECRRRREVIVYVGVFEDDEGDVGLED
jgi:hypothetical protein